MYPTMKQIKTIHLLCVRVLAHIGIHGRCVMRRTFGERLSEVASCLPPCWNRAFHFAAASAAYPKLAGLQASRYFCVCLHSTRVLPQPAFFMWVLEMNVGHQACKVSSLTHGAISLDCFGFLRQGLGICSLGFCATECWVHRNGVPVPSKSTYNGPLPSAILF